MKTSAPLFFSSLFFTILWFHLPLCFGDDAHEEFKACSSVYYNCGDLVHITYPFWGNERQGFCGREEFELYCKDNKTTTIEINSVEFNVLSINQSTHRMTIARSDLLDGYCPRNQIKTATLDQNLFMYSTNDLNLSVWYNCPTLHRALQDYIFRCDSVGENNGSLANNYALEPEVKNLSSYIRGCTVNIEVTITGKVLEEGKKNRATLVEKALKEGFEVEYGDLFTVACEECRKYGGTCGANATHEFYCNCGSGDAHPYVCARPAFHDGFLEFMNFSFNSCQSSVEVPVDFTKEDDDDISGLLRMSYSDVLKMGFTLNWGAQNCSNCETSGGRCGFESNEFVCFCPDGPHSETCKQGKDDKWKKAVIGVCSGIGGILLMSVVFFIWFRIHKKKLARAYAPSSFLLRNTSREPPTKELENGENDMGVPLFSYEELEKATDRFNPAKELGDGGFGTVYYGKLKDGREVAVKRLFENNYRQVEHFMNEVEILTRLRHPHLVTLYGCTSRHCRELLLVYEFISNGTVADHLHGTRAKPGELAWHTRLKIAIETASALTFLHASETIHRDVKTTNILLDSNFSVKVADFGLSRLFPTQATHVSTAPQGTPGYVDPEYHECYQLTSKSDVFSFGVVLVELISSKPAVDITRHRHEINLWTMAINKIRNDELHDFVDPSLGFETDEKVRDMIYAVAELAFRCLQSVKDTRPSMSEALEILKNIESRSSGKGKAEEIDISGEDDVLLKGGSVPQSPDSVVVPWMSKSSTPNGSG